MGQVVLDIIITIKLLSLWSVSAPGNIDQSEIINIILLTLPLWSVSVPGTRTTLLN